MVPERVIPITIAVPRQVKDVLRRMALQQSLENADQIITVSQLGRKILCTFLRERLEELSKGDA
jgi:hypothetical protein